MTKFKIKRHKKISTGGALCGSIDDRHQHRTKWELVNCKKCLEMDHLDPDHAIQVKAMKDAIVDHEIAGSVYLGELFQ